MNGAGRKSPKWLDNFAQPQGGRGAGAIGGGAAWRDDRLVSSPRLGLAREQYPGTRGDGAAAPRAPRRLRADPPQLLSRNGHFMAAVLACGPGAALSHASAAWLLDLRPSGAVKVDITIPKRNGRRETGSASTAPPRCGPPDVITAENIPCTSIARTIFDLAARQDRRGVERILDRASTLRVINLRALGDQIDNNPTRGRGGSSPNPERPPPRQHDNGVTARGGVPGVHTRARSPRSGGPAVARPRRRRLADPSGLTVARPARDRRARRLRPARHPRLLRIRPPP